MKKIFAVIAVLAAALIALPILAGPKPPPPTPKPVGSIKTAHGNTYKVGGTDANVMPTPAADKRKYQTISNASDRDVANTTPTAGPVKSTTVNTTKSNSYREGQPAVTPAPAESINLNSSRSNRVVQPPVTPGNAREVALGGPDTADRGKPTKEQRRITGRVLSQQGRRDRATFTVLSNGKEFTFSAAKLQTLPKVGETIDITYTQTPGGTLEAATINTTRSNTF